MKTLILKNSIVALITPMNKNGDIDKISLKKIINYHINNDTTAIIVAGTTGEIYTLSNKEYMDLIMSALEFSNNRIPILVGTGSNSTSKAISLINILDKIKITGCLNITPYYNKPTQEGLYQHFKLIAENTNLPQIIYNVPARTGCDLLPSTVARLSKIKNIIGIKEATGNLYRVNQLKQLINNDNFILLSGDDLTGLDFVKLGGNGIISVTANIAAKEMSIIYKLASNKQFTEAYNLNQFLLPLHQSLFFEPNPIPVKWACKFLGLSKTDILRLPMTSLTKKGKLIVKLALKYANLIKS